jgi:hypothetical protein
MVLVENIADKLRNMRIKINVTLDLQCNCFNEDIDNIQPT